MKKIAMAFAAACAILLSGCAMTSAPAVGVLFTETTAPISATSAEQGSKVGEATLTSVLGIIATGDASIATAAKNGGITKIKTVDYRSFNILGLYATYTTVVTGE